MLVMTPLFNREWYLTHNPDVAEAVAQGLLDPLEHFLQYGVHEGRSPGPLLDVQYYLRHNPDVAAAVSRGETTAYDHFLSFGMFEGRAPIALFDANYYLTHNPDVAQAVRVGDFTPIQHFVEYGQYEGRIVTPIIDLGAYMGANPDVYRAVQDGEMSAMEHLMLYGIREKRDLGNGIDFGMMDGDPVFLRLLAEGNIVDALLRVTEVAPYLPDYGPPDPDPPGPDPDPGPGPGPWGTWDEPYQLSSSVSHYQLPNTKNYIKLAELASDQIINGGSGKNYFLQNSSAALTSHLKLTGSSNGNDRLFATLDQSLDEKYAPYLTDIPKLILKAQASSGDPGLIDIGLDLRNSRGVETIVNKGSDANLTIKGLREPVILEAKGIGTDPSSGHEFVVEYQDVDPCGCPLDPHVLLMEDAHLSRFSITAYDEDGEPSDGISILVVGAEGSSSIRSFKGYPSEQGLDASLQFIFVAGSGEFELNLSELKGNSDCDCSFVEANFLSYSIAENLMLTLAEMDIATGYKQALSDEDGERKSDLMVVLPCLEPGVLVEIQNMTLASTEGYTFWPTQNDVLDLTDWCISSKEELAETVKLLTIEKGDAFTKDGGSPSYYVDFIFCLDLVGAGTGESTLVLSNVVSVEEYNMMLQALDTIKDLCLESTLCLIDPDGPSLMENGPLSSAFSYPSDPEAGIEVCPEDPLGSEAIMGIIGILVDEGSFLLEWV